MFKLLTLRPLAGSNCLRSGHLTTPTRTLHTTQPFLAVNSSGSSRNAKKINSGIPNLDDPQTKADWMMNQAQQPGNKLDVTLLAKENPEDTHVPIMDNDSAYGTYTRNILSFKFYEQNVFPSYIERFGTEGFVVSSLAIRGVAAIFPKHALEFNVKSIEEFTPENFSLFTMCNPPLELIILGTGDKTQRIPPNLLEYLKKHNIRVEIANTRLAIQTFHFLSEGLWRNIGAVLLPLGDTDPEKDKSAPLKKK